MGKISAKVHDMVCKDTCMPWDDCYDEPCKHKECG